MTDNYRILIWFSFMFSVSPLWLLVLTYYKRIFLYLIGHTFNNDFLKEYFCVPVYRHVHVRSGARGEPKRASYVLELLEEVVSCLMLGAKLRSPARAAHCLNHCANLLLLYLLSPMPGFLSK